MAAVQIYTQDPINLFKHEQTQHHYYSPQLEHSIHNLFQCNAYLSLPHKPSPRPSPSLADVFISPRDIPAPPPLGARSPNRISHTPSLSTPLQLSHSKAADAYKADTTALVSRRTKRSISMAAPSAVAPMMPALPSPPAFNLPPPPKVGEKAKPPQYYSNPSSPTRKANHHNLQLSDLSFTPYCASPPRASPAISPRTTEINCYFQHQPLLQTVEEGQVLPDGVNTPFPLTPLPASPGLGPSGYMQNPYAADLTPEQRFANELQSKRGSDVSMSLGYLDGVNTRSRSESSAASTVAATLEDIGVADMWDSAKEGLMNLAGSLGGVWHHAAPGKVGVEC